MDVQEYLKQFKTAFDPKLKGYFDARIKDARGENMLVADALEHVKKITLAGGKRLRPAFMMAGYQAAEGEDKERLLETSLAVELIHMFLLIHDDIIDRDHVRHGVTTLHEQYAGFGKRMLSLDSPEHFGNAIALIVGDMLFAFGNNVLFTSGFPEERVLAALSKTQQIVSYTSIGEVSDIYNEYRGVATTEEVLKMYEQKTARYTFEGPLHLGAILAGRAEELLEPFSQYALPLGRAFQIQDDLLGVFGSEAKIGKPVGSDIQEGKLTILVTTVFEKAKQYRGELADILHKGSKLTKDDIERFRKIVTESGAVDHVKSLARHSLDEARRAIGTLALPATPRAFLVGVADYLADRDY